MGLEDVIPEFERAKTVHDLDRGLCDWHTRVYRNMKYVEMD
jgi:hypothetical protein